MTCLRRLREVLSESAPEAYESAETVCVRLWRFEQLVGAGYSAQGATEMARNPAVDLELARRLVQRLGCPPDLARRILM
jgi:hypothetical protein